MLQKTIDELRVEKFLSVIVQELHVHSKRDRNVPMLNATTQILREKKDVQMEMMKLQNVHIQEVKTLMIVQEDQVHLTNVQNVHTIKVNINLLRETTNAERISVNVQRHLVHSMRNQNVHIQNEMIHLHQEKNVRVVHSMKQHQKEITIEERVAMIVAQHLEEI